MNSNGKRPHHPEEAGDVVEKRWKQEDEVSLFYLDILENLRVEHGEQLVQIEKEREGLTQKIAVLQLRKSTLENKKEVDDDLLRQLVDQLLAEQSLNSTNLEEKRRLEEKSKQKDKTLRDLRHRLEESEQSRLASEQLLKTAQEESRLQSQLGQRKRRSYRCMRDEIPKSKPMNNDDEEEEGEGNSDGSENSMEKEEIGSQDSEGLEDEKALKSSPVTEDEEETEEGLVKCVQCKAMVPDDYLSQRDHTLKEHAMAMHKMKGIPKRRVFLSRWFVKCFPKASVTNDRTCFLCAAEGVRYEVKNIGSDLLLKRGHAIRHHLKYSIRVPCPRAGCIQFVKNAISKIYPHMQKAHGVAKLGEELTKAENLQWEETKREFYAKVDPILKRCFPFEDENCRRGEPVKASSSSCLLCAAEGVKFEVKHSLVDHNVRKRHHAVRQHRNEPVRIPCPLSGCNRAVNHVLCNVSRHLKRAHRTTLDRLSEPEQLHWKEIRERYYEEADPVMKECFPLKSVV